MDEKPEETAVSCLFHLYYFVRLTEFFCKKVSFVNFPIILHYVGQSSCNLEQLESDNHEISERNNILVLEQKGFPISLCLCKLES